MWGIHNTLLKYVPLLCVPTDEMFKYCMCYKSFKILHPILLTTVDKTPTVSCILFHATVSLTTYCGCIQPKQNILFFFSQKTAEKKLLSTCERDDYEWDREIAEQGLRWLPRTLAIAL